MILIDDLDRLDKKEIYEVIRLIRNTANFANTFFIVAYDRNYVLNALEEINPYQSQYFLEKIFQIEFTLPPAAHKTIQDEITRRINPLLTDDDKNEYSELIENGYAHLDYGFGNLTYLFVNNIRDVVRFVNSLRLNYEFVKNEVYFRDFYNLELIRYKHPELFLEIYRRSESLVTADKYNRGKWVSSGNEYSLTQDTDTLFFLGRSIGCSLTSTTTTSK